VIAGNDPELDPNREPEPPTRALDKPAPRHGKRDAPKEAPVRPTEGGAPRRTGKPGGNEAGMSFHVPCLLISSIPVTSG
jgi:plasminogen activator inhibitor 1 RNA-binding protein